MNDPSAALGKMVPGFDFLQNLARGAGSAAPGMGHWVAPTLDPEEIGKRIEELRTVQFWLEQNVRMMSTTIQALEVQRMTLATLQGMNVPLAELRGALMAGGAGGWPATAASASSAPASDWQSGPFGQALAASAARRSSPPPTSSQAAPESAEAPTPPAPPPREAAAQAAASTPETAGVAPAMDPVRWWESLTQQFTQIAGQALKDMPGHADPTGDLMTRSTRTAQEALRQQAALVQQATQALGAGAMASAVASPSAGRTGSGTKPASGKRVKPAGGSPAKTSARQSDSPGTPSAHAARTPSTAARRKATRPAARGRGKTSASPPNRN